MGKEDKKYNSEKSKSSGNTNKKTDKNGKIVAAMLFGLLGNK